MLTCREITDFLEAFDTQTLPLTQRLAFQAHLLLCRDCRHYLASYKTVSALVQALREAPSDCEVAVPPALLNAIHVARAAGGAPSTAMGSGTAYDAGACPQRDASASAETASLPIPPLEPPESTP